MIKPDMIGAALPPAVVDPAAQGGLMDRRALLGLALGIGAVGVLGGCSDERDSTSVPPISNPEATTSVDIDTTKERQDLAQSSDPQLQVLAGHEARLGHAFSELMFFHDIPLDDESGRRLAAEMVPRLQEFAKQGVAPLMVFEPEGLDLAHGDQTGLAVLFRTLKEQGITDEQMGTSIFYSEPNIPAWGVEEDKGNTDPATFVRNFSDATTALREAFPDAQVAVLLDSESYPSGDVNYARGSYASLIPYVEGLPKVDRFILQGLPWAAAANSGSNYANYDPSKFVDADLAIEAAKRLGISDVMFNTGTYGTKYSKPEEQITVPASERGRVLRGILTEAGKVQAAGLKASVNVFAENKMDVDEATDWSYKGVEAEGELRRFADAAANQGVDVIIFDQ